MEEFIRIFMYPYRDETKKVSNIGVACWSAIAMVGIFYMIVTFIGKIL